MIYEIIKELASDNSRLFKESVLTKHKDNDLLKRVIVAALNPYINYHIIQLPEYITTNTQYDLNWALDNLEVLARREKTGHDARDHLRFILSNLSANHAEVVKLIIGRDLKCGVADSTVNKIWKELIPEMSYMRCSLPKSVKLDKWDWLGGVFSQLKADGSFCNGVVPLKGAVELITRNGTIYPDHECFADIKKDLMSTGAGVVYAGELVVYRDGVLLPREESNGILNSIAKGGNSLQLNDVVTYMVWDVIPYESWRTGAEFKTPYSARFTMIYDLFANAAAVQVIETEIVHSYDEAIRHYESLIAAGFEGTIIKTSAGYWKNSTSKDQVKLKVDVDIDLEIIGFNAGKGKNVNTFGSIECVSSDRLFNVNVSGFKDKEREEISKDKDSYIGKIMTVRINNLMKPSGKKETWSAFLPRKIEIRDDKTVADDLQRIKDQYDAVIKIK